MRDFTLQKLVIRNDLATLAEVRRAMWATQTTAHTWLEELVLTGGFDEARYLERVVKELRVPPCDVHRLAHVPAAVRALIPADLAAEHRVVPLWLESDGDLRVVVADPTDRWALDEVQFFAGRRLLREVAAPTLLASALERYYGVPNVLAPLADAIHALAA